MGLENTRLAGVHNARVLQGGPRDGQPLYRGGNALRHSHVWNLLASSVKTSRIDANCV